MVEYKKLVRDLFQILVGSFENAEHRKMFNLKLVAKIV